MSGQNTQKELFYFLELEQSKGANMTSKIDPSGINAAYPVASLNQSSQGFRDNFKSIKNALVNAKTENTLILSTTISVSGDGIDPYTSTSIELANGNIPLTLNLTSQGNVVPGTYDLRDTIISLNVNDKGVITGLHTEDPLPTFDTGNGMEVVKTQDDPNYPGNAGISTITLPTVQTNKAGRVVTTGTKTFSGFGLLGYYQPKGTLLVGSSTNHSTFLPAGLNNQVLTLDSNSPTGFSWATPTTGTVTGVSAGLGLSSNNSSSTPEIDLNINALPTNNSLTDGTKFLSYDGNHYVTNWTSLRDTILQSVKNLGYISHLSDDQTPKLSSTLDTNGQEIKNTSSSPLNITSASDLNLQGDNVGISGNGVTLSSNSLKLNGLTIPNNPPPNGNMVLTVDQNGNIGYTNRSDFNTLVSGDPVVTSTQNDRNVNLSFTPWNLNTGAATATTMVMAVDKTNQKSNLVPISSIIGAAGTPGVVFVSNQGDDNYGNGTMTSPFMTISKAVSSNISSSIVLLPGSYDPGETQSNISLSAFINGTVQIGSTKLYNCSIQGVEVTGNVEFHGCTISSCTISAAITTSNQNTITTTTINNDVNNYGVLVITGCTNTNGQYANIVTNNSPDQVSTTIVSSSYMKFTHYSGMATLDSIQFLGPVFSYATGDQSELVIRNASLSTGIDENTGRTEWNTIQKTGDCPYIIQNVARMASRDTLKGRRQEYSSIDADLGGIVRQDNVVSSSYKLSPAVRYYDLTIKTVANINISWDETQTAFDTGKYVTDMTVIVRGDGGPAKLIWPSGVFTDDNYTYSARTPTTVFHFVRTSTGWICDYSSDDGYIKSIIYPNEGSEKTRNIWMNGYGSLCSTSQTQGNRNNIRWIVTGQTDNGDEKVGLRLKTDSNDIPVYGDLDSNSQVRYRQLALKSDTDNLYNTKQNKGNYISGDFGKAENDPIGIGLHTNNVSGRANYWDSTGSRGDLAFYNDVTNAINNIPLSGDSNNLLRKVEDGYLVKIEPPPDISNQFVSSSKGDDVNGNGSREKPFKTLKRALNRIPDFTSATINLWYQDEFEFTDGSTGFVPNGSYKELVAGGWYLGSRNLYFQPYGSPTWDNTTNLVFPRDGLQLESQPIINFTYYKPTDNDSLQCPGFWCGSGKMYFTQIGLRVRPDNLPNYTIGAAWQAPFCLQNGSVTCNGCTMYLANGVFYGADGSNGSSGTIANNYYCYYNTDNGYAYIDSKNGYTVKLSFFDNPSIKVQVNGQETPYWSRPCNVSKILTSKSFLGLTIINQGSRTYEGMITQNNINY